MNEIWRTLKPGGIFLSSHAHFSIRLRVQGPTHVNIMTIQTFPMYFDNKCRWASIYGFRGSFEIVDQSIKEFWLISLLRKPM